ncbi:MAG TPA: hypothetical protein PL110_17685 [Candidatus Eremiobacteraeota bacterium]|nr:MAG: hypothetical protein BWY64_03538 [bacterium ADurb.Bin363]HPZ09928.1 hypothetical protein [Candidatus Eremiobacteraeota bacterium]
MRVNKKEKAMILIITAWVIVILLIIGVALANMSLSNLFHIGYYTQKQQAIDLADCAAREVIGRLIANNNYGKSGETLPDDLTPPQFKNKDIYISFDKNAPGRPSWLPASKFIYSYNNLQSSSIITTNGIRKVPPVSVDIISYAKVGRTFVKIEILTAPGLTTSDPLAIGAVDKIDIDNVSFVNIYSQDGSIPTIWSKSDREGSVEIDAKDFVFLGSGKGSAGSKCSDADRGVVINTKTLKGKKESSTKLLADGLKISALATETQYEMPHGGTFIRFLEPWGFVYKFYEDVNDTPGDTSDDVLSFYVDQNGVHYYGAPPAIPLGKAFTVPDMTYLNINKNIKINGNLTYIADKYTEGGFKFNDGSYLHLSNNGNEIRWSDVNPENCTCGANMTDSDELVQPDRLNPADPNQPAPSGPYVDKPVYGNFSFYNGRLQGEGSIYAEGAVTIDAKATTSFKPKDEDDDGSINRDPNSFESGKRANIAIYSQGDINLSSPSKHLALTGLCYSHEDIIIDKCALTFTGAMVVTGKTVLDPNNIDDPNDIRTGKFILTGYNPDISYFILQFDQKYLKALQYYGTGSRTEKFIISSWVVE